MTESSSALTPRGVPPAPPAPLSRVRWLSLIDGEDLAAIMGASTQRSFQRGETVLAAGQVPDALCVLLNGQAHVMFEDTVRRRSLRTAILKPGDAFGEADLIGGHPCVSSVRAAATSEVLCVERAHFLTVLLRNNALMYHFMRHLVVRLRVSTEQIRRMATLDVAERVACALFDMAQHDRGRSVVHGRLPRGELALQVGATRQRVGRVLRGFEAQGWLRRSADGRLVLSTDLRDFAGLPAF